MSGACFELQCHQSPLHHEVKYSLIDLFEGIETFIASIHGLGTGRVVELHVSLGQPDAPAPWSSTSSLESRFVGEILKLVFKSSRNFKTQL